MAMILRYQGSNFLRQRLCLATVSGRPVVITDIRPKDENPGLRDFEASFVRMLDKICDGSEINIDETGTVL
jgi:RNA 3'-terminal phosphate cyclase-like protein